MTLAGLCQRLAANQNPVTSVPGWLQERARSFMKQPDTPDADYLWDILTAGRAIENFVAGMSYVDYTE